jgi:hypothetical protein
VGERGERETTGGADTVLEHVFPKHVAEKGRQGVTVTVTKRFITVVQGKSVEGLMGKAFPRVSVLYFPRRTGSAGHGAREGERKRERQKDLEIINGMHTRNPRTGSHSPLFTSRPAPMTQLKLHIVVGPGLQLVHRDWKSWRRVYWRTSLADVPVPRFRRTSASKSECCATRMFMVFAHVSQNLHACSVCLHTRLLCVSTYILCFSARRSCMCTCVRACVHASMRASVDVQRLHLRPFLHNPGL